MSWRCAWCMKWVASAVVTCTWCGRDIEHPTPGSGPGRPRIPDGDGKEVKRAYDRERKAKQKAAAHVAELEAALAEMTRQRDDLDEMLMEARG